MNDETLFSIHVFDRNSSTFLTLETDKALYHYGDQLTVNLSLGNEAIDYPMDIVNASLVSPDGEVIPLIINSMDPDHYRAKLKLTSEKNSQGENWYVEADVTSLLGTQTIKRQAHTAFSYAIPSASIKEISFLNAKKLSFSAKIDVATTSRYALQAVLFATDRRGKKHPIQIAQSAAWLIKGKNNLDFSFDSTLTSDYKAPYYLGYIQLTDFGQFKSVYEYNHPIKLTT